MMDKFRSTLKKRLFIMTLINILALLFIVLTGIYGNSTAGTNENIAGFIRGFQASLFLLVQGAMLFHIFKYRRALNNKEKLKKLYIEENDERKKMIKDKIGGGGFFFSTAIIAAATVAAGFINQTVFFTLGAVTFFMTAIKATLKIYYKIKF